MEPIKDICQAISNAGGRALIVGGAVRDMLLGVDPKDFDLEVFGLMPDEFVLVLEKFGKVEHRGLGKFPTYALRVGDMDVEFSSPRSDSKTGPKHSDFTVLIDPFMSIEDAARRRDFTMNSMSFDPLNGMLYDPFCGKEDLSAGMLAVTDEAHFGEDPLRVLRGMQFCGRMLLVSDRETDILCASLVDQARYLSPSAVWGEWEKWALKSKLPAAGLYFLSDCGWLSLYPALDNLRDVEQDEVWHPEGTAWHHTLYTVNAMVKLCERKGITGEERLIRVFAALLHDVGKPTTTVKAEDGRIRSIGHERAGVEPAKGFLKSIGCPLHIQEKVLPLIAEHMNYKGAMASKKALRKFVHRLGKANVYQLCDVVYADHAGRPPLPVDREEVLNELIGRCREAGIDQGIKPVVTGKHLIALGWTPGPHMGRALTQCHQAWLGGKFDTVADGIKYAGKVK